MNELLPIVLFDLFPFSTSVSCCHFVSLQGRLSSTVLPKHPAFARLQMMSETSQAKSETLHIMCNGDYILLFLSASVCCLTLFASWFVNAESAQQMSWLLQDCKEEVREHLHIIQSFSLFLLRKSLPTSSSSVH
jgi:hypothetical protein